MGRGDESLLPCHPGSELRLLVLRIGRREISEAIIINGMGNKNENGINRRLVSFATAPTFCWQSNWNAGGRFFAECFFLEVGCAYVSAAKRLELVLGQRS